MSDTHEVMEWLRKIVTSRCDAQRTAKLDSLTAELALKERMVEVLAAEVASAYDRAGDRQRIPQGSDEPAYWITWAEAQATA